MRWWVAPLGVSNSTALLAHALRRCVVRSALICGRAVVADALDEAVARF